MARPKSTAPAGTPKISIPEPPDGGGGGGTLIVLAIIAVLGGMYVAFNPSYDPDTCEITGVSQSQHYDAKDRACGTPDAGKAFSKQGEMDMKGIDRDARTYRDKYRQ